MSDSQVVDALTRIKNILYPFCAEKQIEISEIESGFVLDVPVEYEILVEGQYDKDLDSVTEEVKPTSQTASETRKQFVYVTLNRKGLENEDILQIFTICAPEEERFYKSALLLNMNLPFGAFAISQVEDQNYFVLVDTYLVDSITEKELLTSIMALAKSGDKLEKMLVGEDLA